mmetsp:Transcript_9200/g.19830  ORF Transcript_9200/g.19830 Transcript_9200/m.19830 type:complete len:258 (-) Transcript_9200:1626-2399(-)
MIANMIHCIQTISGKSCHDHSMVFSRLWQPSDRHVRVSDCLDFEDFSLIGVLVKTSIQCFEQHKDLGRFARRAPSRESCNVRKHDRRFGIEIRHRRRYLSHRRQGFHGIGGQIAGHSVGTRTARAFLSRRGASGAESQSSTNTTHHGATGSGNGATQVKQAVANLAGEQTRNDIGRLYRCLHDNGLSTRNDEIVNNQQKAGKDVDCHGGNGKNAGFVVQVLILGVLGGNDFESDGAILRVHGWIGWYFQRRLGDQLL